jgi:hypothetical protein
MAPLSKARDKKPRYFKLKDEITLLAFLATVAMP